MRLIILTSTSDAVDKWLQKKAFKVLQRNSNGVEQDLLLDPGSKASTVSRRAIELQHQLAENDIPSSIIFDHDEGVEVGAHLAIRFDDKGNEVRTTIAPNPEKVDLVAIEQVLAKYPNPVKAVHAVREFIRTTREERSVLPWGTQDDYRKRRKTARLILKGTDT